MKNSGTAVGEEKVEWKVEGAIYNVKVDYANCFYVFFFLSFFLFALYRFRFIFQACSFVNVNLYDKKDAIQAGKSAKTGDHKKLTT